MVKIWNKPKFVLESHYVITLDRIAAREGGEALLEKILAYPGMEQQVQEWRDLGMVGEDFTTEDVWETNQTGRCLHFRYQYLPLDTRYFPDLELAIIGLFDHLDEALDGWLVHSENYQALKTMLPKFRERVNCVYIDPPYNSPYSEIPYVNRYKHSTWLTMVENRLIVSKGLLRDEFVYMISIDDFEQTKLGELLGQVFPESKKSFITVVHNQRGQQGKNFSYVHEYAYFLYPDDQYKYIADRPRDEVDLRNLRDSGTESLREDAKNCFYPILVKGDKIIGFGEIPSDDYHPSAQNEERGDGVIYVWPIDTQGKERKWRYARQSVEQIADSLQVVRTRYGVQIYLGKEIATARTVWYGSKYDASEYGTKVLQDLFGETISNEFKYPKSVHFMEDVLNHVASIQAGKGIILDFFAGSGTTAHAVINLNREDSGKRKYILVEMGDYFHTVLLPRIKKVVYSDKWDNGKAQPDGNGIGHFIKYFRLEQYEETLRRAHYEDVDFLFIQADPYSQYVFMRDKKMLDNAETGEKVVEIDTEKNEIRVYPSKLYDNIDLAETLSCVTGKWIRRIYPAPDDPTKPGEVEFEDGERVNLKNPPWKLIKPLIWW